MRIHPFLAILLLAVLVLALGWLALFMTTCWLPYSEPAGQNPAAATLENARATGGDKSAPGLQSQAEPRQRTEVARNPDAPTIRIVGRLLGSPRLPLHDGVVRAIEARAHGGARAVASAGFNQNFDLGLDTEAPTLAETALRSDGQFELTVHTRHSRLGLVLDHDYYALPSPHEVAVRGDLIDVGDLPARLGALVFGRVTGFDPLLGVELQIAAEIDQSAVMTDPQGFRAQMLAQGRGRVTTDAEGRFRFRAVPATPSARVLAQDARALGRSRALSLTAGDSFELLIAAQTGATLRVEVRDSNDAPAVGAEVMVEPRDIDGSLARARSQKEQAADRDGVAVLAPLAAGRARLNVSHLGHVTHRADVDLESGATRTLQVRLAAGAQITGVVVDAQDQPVVDAGVTQQASLDIPMFGDMADRFAGSAYAAMALAAKVRSGRDGRFRLGGLAADDNVTVIAAHADYVATSMPKVAAGTTDLRIVLRRGASVRGEVLRQSDHTPLPAFRVAVVERVMGMMELPQRSEDLASADGRFTLNKLRPGSFTLRITAEGYTPHEAKLELRADAEVDIGRIELPAAARVLGRVVDREGRGVAGAQIRVRRGGLEDNEMFAAMRGTQGGARSKADGTFTLDDVPAGRTRLRASAPGFAPVESDRLEVVAGTELRDVVLTLGHGGTIQGRLLLPSHRDARDFDLVTSEVSARYTGSAVLATDGRFTASNLLPGRYNVQAIDRGAMQRANATLMDNMREGGKLDLAGMMKSASRATVQARCVVRDGETTEVELDARELDTAGVELLLDVRVGDEPLASGFAEVAGAQGSSRMTLIERGAGTVDGLTPGSYTVRVREGLTFAPLGDGEQVTVAERPQQQRVTLRLPAGRLSGSVVHDRTGEPLARAFVRVHGARSASDKEADFGFALSDERGRFSIGGLTAGRYAVVADDGPAKQEGGAGGRIEDIALRDGEHKDGLLLRARPAAGVSVVVREESGAPAAHAMLLAIDEQGAPLGTRGLAFADAEGRAFLAGLPAGKVRIAARGRNHAPALSELREVAPGGETELSVQLRHGARVAVSAVDAQGKPLQVQSVAVRFASGPWLPASLLAGAFGGEHVDLGELPPGRVRFLVSAVGHAPFEVEREVPASGRASLVLAAPR